MGFILIVSLNGCKRQSEPAKEPPKKEAVSSAVKFPEIEGWKLGKVKTYKGEELYGPIDGEADRYFPFGFERAYFASYEKVDGKGIIDVQIFQMDSSDNAFGIYTMYDITSPDRDLIKNDVLASTLSGAALDFVKSSYFVRISQHEMDANKDLLVSFGDSIARVLEGKSEKPQIISLLPAGYTSGKTRYFHKWETYKEFIYVITENIFNLTEKTQCVLASYLVNPASSLKSESELLIIEYPDSESAVKALMNVKEFFSKSPFKSETNADGWIIINTHWGKVAMEKNFICLVIYADRIEFSDSQIKQAIENIRKSGNQ